MARQVINTCDNCGCREDNLYKVSMFFDYTQDRRMSYYTCSIVDDGKEVLKGEYCNSCLRKMVEFNRKQFAMEYKTK